MESDTEPKTRPPLLKTHNTSLSISSLKSKVSSLNSNAPLLKSKINDSASETFRVLKKFASFVGPGFLVAVAYIDPGNYSTDVAAGASNEYALLFVVIMSNMFAIFLQSLCIKLGSVTGMDLAENCRAHLPKWMVIPLYILAEGAIIATDVAEVYMPLSFPHP
jgi:metal iron transporter